MKHTFMSILGVLVVTLGADTARATSHGPTPIAHCTTISAPGAYVLTNNLAATTGDCIDITASDVQLSLNGFSILCPSIFCDIGINVAKTPATRTGTLDRVDIMGPGSIFGFATAGISLQASHSRVEGLVLTVDEPGIDIGFTSPVSDDEILNNTLTEDDFGIRASADRSEFKGNIVSNASVGIEISAGHEGKNTVIDNETSSSQVFGIEVSGGCGNVISGNVSNETVPLAQGMELTDMRDSDIDMNTVEFSLNGMIVQSVTGSHFKANTFIGNNRVGLLVDAASTGNVLVNNTALANGHEDFEDAADAAGPDCPNVYVKPHCVTATPTTCIVCIPPG